MWSKADIELKGKPNKSARWVIPRLGTWKLLTLKKCTIWELRVKFYLGQNEDYSVGDSLSDSSEKLLQSGGRESNVSIYVILVKGKYMQSSTFLNYYFFFFFGRRFLLVKRQASPWRNLVLFSIWGDTRVRLIKSAPENICLKACSASFPPSTEGLIFALLPELSSGGCWWSAATVARDRGKWQVPICSWQLTERGRNNQKPKRSETQNTMNSQSRGREGSRRHQSIL